MKRRPPERERRGASRPDDKKGGAPKVESKGGLEAKDGRLGRIHDRALDVTALLAERVPLDRALDQVFRRSRDLGSSERAEITELAHAFARSERRIDDRLARAAKALKKDLSIIDRPVYARLRLLAFHLDRGEALEALEARDPYAFKRIPGLFARIAKGLTPAALAIEHNLPDPVAARLVGGFGEARAEAIAVALEGRAPFTVRVNTLKATREAAAAALAPLVTEPTRYAPNGLLFERRAALGGLAPFEDGWLEPQDEGSQLIALAVGARPGEVVYDACAGAGGKTLALAAAMQNQGRLLAFDREASKLEELMRRARRAGVTSHESRALDFVTLPSELVGRADRVLVDAPCTGTGTFRRHPDARWHLTEAHLLELPARQHALLVRAIDACKVGGLVVYATCSVLPDEDEAILARVLGEDRRVEPAPLAETLGPALASELGATHELRLGPGPGPRDPDGFYLAALRRVR